MEYERKRGMDTEEDNLDADFDSELGELTIELYDGEDEFDLELDLDSDWDDEETDDEAEPQSSRSQSLKSFAGDWENRWAEWKWMDDHDR